MLTDNTSTVPAGNSRASSIKDSKFSSKASKSTSSDSSIFVVIDEEI